MLTKVVGGAREPDNVTSSIHDEREGLGWSAKAERK